MRRAVHPVPVALALAMGVGWFAFPGLLWDVSWHRTFGRDSFLSPPHLPIYAAVAMNGYVAAWAILLRARGGEAKEFGVPVVRILGFAVPAGFGLVGLGFSLAIAGAVFDEAWHRTFGKDANVWSPPHLVGIGGGMIIVVGLVLALASHTRFHVDRRWLPRALMLFLLADLVHKSTMLLDYYTLEPARRTADFYPFLLALLLPAVFLTAARALGPGAATAVAVVYAVEHCLIVTLLSAFGLGGLTLSPLPILPALAIDLVLAAARRRRGAPGAAIVSGIAFALVLYAVEGAWMAWGLERPWAWRAVLSAFPAVAVTAAGSAWVGWSFGGFVAAAAEGQPASSVFGTPRAARRVAVTALVLVAIGLVASYRPSRAEPPARLADLGLRADVSFDARDAVFFTLHLPEGWRRPGAHRAYQEGVLDGRPFPVGPAWCAADERTLQRDLAAVRFDLFINGERVALEAFPAVRRKGLDGETCQWIGVSATTPRLGRQQLLYVIRYTDTVQTSEGEVGPGTSWVAMDLAIKEP